VLLATLLAWVSSGALAQAEPLQLLSYNIRIDFDGASLPRRLETIDAIFSAQNYDVIALQEASEVMIAAYQELLPGYHYIVGERSDGHRGDQQWYEFMPVFYNFKRLKLQRHGSFWIGEDPEQPGATLQDSKWHGRVLTWLHLQDRVSRQAFVLANVHIHGQRADAAATLIVQRMKALAGTLPLILAGDFNTAPDTDAYRLLTASEHFALQDSQQAAMVSDAVEHTAILAGEFVPAEAEGRKEGGNPKRIDYVFVDPSVAVHRYEVGLQTIEPNWFPSDHLPLGVEFSLSSRSLSHTRRLQDLERVTGGPDVLVVAHRSCWRQAPENSLAAMDHCIELGADMLEIDVRQTADGQLVVIHDDTVDRTTARTGLVEEFSLAELSTMRLKEGAGGPAAELTSHLIPSLSETLDHLRGRILINLDAKEEVRDQVASLVASKEMQGQVLIKAVAASPQADSLQGATYLERLSFMPILRPEIGRAHV